MTGTSRGDGIIQKIGRSRRRWSHPLAIALFAVLSVTGAFGATPNVAEKRLTLPTPQPIASGQIDAIYSTERTPHAQGGVAGTAPGTNLYRNESNNLALYRPGANQRMADDMQLVCGGGDLVYFELLVAGNAANGPAFTAHVELWNGDPCLGTSTLIQGTQVDFTNIPNNSTAQSLEATIDPPIAIPGTVWMAVTFSGAGAANAGWIVGEQAETGTTADVFSQNAPGGCSLFTLTGLYSGFWANINVQLGQTPLGACCGGSICTQTTQAGCAGVWQGVCTSCEPNICQAGACCAGSNFGICSDSNEAACQGTVFHAADSCGAGACGPNFKLFENDFVTSVIVPVAQGQKWADDLRFGPGPPCEMLAYDVVVGGVTNPVTNFDVHLELWTNNDNGTPNLDEDDIPSALIPGTELDAHNIPADALRHTLFFSSPPGIVLPKKVWLVMTSTPPGGPEFGGLANIGNSIDGFAIFNHSSHPGAWTPGFRFGTNGFDPTHCPGAQCVPAGSFRADVWCSGNPPVGACCSATSGTCRENVAQEECHGRWVEGETCDSASFDPPCGASACCYKFPPNPSFIICQDFTQQECTANLGESAPKEQFCGTTTCPRAECINVTGSCTLAHGTPGCEDGYCCDKVCAADNFCCATSWDAGCVTKAQQLCQPVQNNDDCVSAKSISGPGTFAFDNTNATTDGPDHLACLSTGETQIDKDVWFCWHATCDGPVFVRTCDGTTIDTKIAVYNGCTCPPTDIGLLTCNDDLCNFQSMSVINAVSGHDYMVRVGVYPGSLTGAGSLTISCGPPSNPSCPGIGGCCTAHNSGQKACNNANCCNSVCACDPYCCETEWDDGCANLGYTPPGGDPSGCGALPLCGSLCGPDCPVGPVNFTNPVNGAVDARIPHSINNAIQTLGISTIVATGPPGAVASCWTLCETQSTGTANSITNVSENAGTYTLTLARPITTNAVTTITYTNVSNFGITGQFIAHPSNVNGVNTADVQDLLDLKSAIKGAITLPFGLLSTDIDRSGAFTPLDLLEEINLFNGAGEYQVWSGTPLPSAGRRCP